MEKKAWLIRKFYFIEDFEMNDKANCDCCLNNIYDAKVAQIYVHYVLDLWFKEMVKSNSKGEAFICRFY